MPQSLFMPVETAREEVSPQADAALAATEETRIAMARIRGCALDEERHGLVLAKLSWWESHLRVGNVQRLNAKDDLAGHA